MADTTHEQDQAIERLSIEHGGEPLHVTHDLGDGLVAVHLPGVDEPLILDEDGGIVPVPPKFPRFTEGRASVMLVDGSWIVGVPAKYSTAIAHHDGLNANVHLDEDTARDLYLALRKALVD